MKMKINNNKIWIIILILVVFSIVVLLLTGIIKVNTDDADDIIRAINPEEIRVDGRCGHRDDGKTIRDPNNPNVKLICTYNGNTCPRFTWKIKEIETTDSPIKAGKKCGHLLDGNIITNPEDPNTQLICMYIENNEPKYSWQVIDGEIVENINNDVEIKEGNACSYKKLDDVEEDINTGLEIICTDMGAQTPKYIWQKV